MMITTGMRLRFGSWRAGSFCSQQRTRSGLSGLSWRTNSSAAPAATGGS